jgi:hypothetical protein
MEWRLTNKRSNEMARGKTNVEVRISHNGDRLYDFYNQTLADLRARHMHPEQTFLGKYGELTAEEAAKISCRDAEGRAAASRSGVHWVQDNRQGGHWECSDGSSINNKVF